jgi:hypothetical protein
VGAVIASDLAVELGTGIGLPPLAAHEAPSANARSHLERASAMGTAGRAVTDLPLAFIAGDKHRSLRCSLYHT